MELKCYKIICFVDYSLELTLKLQGTVVIPDNQCSDPGKLTTSEAETAWDLCNWACWSRMTARQNGPFEIKRKNGCVLRRDSGDGVVGTNFLVENADPSDRTVLLADHIGWKTFTSIDDALKHYKILEYARIGNR